MMARWPVVLVDHDLRLQPLRRRDRRMWTEVRARNVDWLAPWEATTPRPTQERPASFSELVRRQRQQAMAGQSLPWALWHKDALIGQVTVTGIVGGAARLCHVGYWIDQRFAGQGFMPRAVAMAARYALEVLDLHRVEIAIRPENLASLRVVEKLGFTYEGRRRAFLHIAGDWRDHDVFTLTADALCDPTHRINSFASGAVR